MQMKVGHINMGVTLLIHAPRMMGIQLLYIIALLCVISGSKVLQSQ